MPRSPTESHPSSASPAGRSRRMDGGAEPRGPSVHRARVGSAAALVAAVFFFAGCANLQAVRDFAKTSAATADYRQIVADYAGSPGRQKRFQPERRAADLDAEAKARAEQRKTLEAAQKVLAEYLSALGDLAADELPNVDKEIDSLSKALEKAKFVGSGDAAIGKETAAAAGVIAKILIRGVLDHWRQQNVKETVEASDESVQTVVAGMGEVVSKDFSASLDIEAEAIRKHFGKPIAEARSKGREGEIEPIVRVLSADHLDEVAVRREKLAAYAAVLAKIGKGHADLRANSGKLRDKALRERLGQYAKDIQALYKAIMDLSS